MLSSQLISSTIGKKALMALTGLYALFFVIVHLLANLTIYQGPGPINEYAHLLEGFPKFVWTYRLTLILAIGIHIWLSLSLSRQNQKARSIAYVDKKSRKATLASRTMLFGGLTVLCFIIYHLAHFTLGITNPEYTHLFDMEGRRNVYNMVVMGFSNPLVSGFYILAQVFLALHISHGIASSVRTLGLADAKTMTVLEKGGSIFALVMALLYVSIPLSVLLGFITLR